VEFHLRLFSVCLMEQIVVQVIYHFVDACMFNNGIETMPLQ